MFLDLCRFSNIGNSRVMQVFGIMQVSNRDELCRFLEFVQAGNSRIYVGVWNYVGFPIGNSRVNVGVWNYVGFQQGTRELRRFLELYSLSSMELANFMQVYGIMQAIQQGIRELCRFVELCRFSSREFVSYVGVWNYLGFQQGTHELRRFLELYSFPKRHSRILCRCLELCRFPSREFASYVGVWNYAGVQSGMQVLGIIQVFHSGIRDLCRLLELCRFSSREFELCRLRVMQVFWNYVGVQTGISRIMYVFGLMQVFQSGICELCRCLDFCRFPIREFVGFGIPCWISYITPQTYIIREFPIGQTI